jgi:hypothetical protein
VAKLANAVLWLLLAALIVTVVLMTWHPWVTPWTGVRR